jgi:hypothetical protein
MAAASFEGAATIFESGTWSAWKSLEVNGDFSAVSCPAVSYCVVVSEAGQAFTYGSPPAGSSPTVSGGAITGINAGITAGAVLSTSGSAPAPGSPIGKGRPLVDTKTGEITLEYSFPEPGEVEAYGEVVDGTTLSHIQASGMLSSHEPHAALEDALGQPTRKVCKTRYVRSGKRCISSAPVRYGRARLAIPIAGTYKLHIKPPGKVLTALRKNKTLTVRLTLVFTPQGTSDHLHETVDVRVDLGRRTDSQRHALAKR